jgi:hypothetical protein
VSNNTAPPLWAVVLPYCIQAMTGLRERAVLLNRDYKPLGFAGERGVHYEDYPEAHIHIELYKLLKPSDGSFYFFGGSNGPWASTARLREYREKIRDLVSPWIDAKEWAQL